MLYYWFKQPSRVVKEGARDIRGDLLDGRRARLVYSAWTNGGAGLRRTFMCRAGGGRCVVGARAPFEKATRFFAAIYEKAEKA